MILSTLLERASAIAGSSTSESTYAFTSPSTEEEIEEMNASSSSTLATTSVIKASSSALALVLVSRG